MIWIAIALWSRTAKDTDVNTGPLARSFTRLLAPLTRSLARSLCSLPRSWESEFLKSQNDLVLFHSAASSDDRVSSLSDSRSSRSISPPQELPIQTQQQLSQHPTQQQQQHEVAAAHGLESSSPTLVRMSVCFAVIAIICVGIGTWRVRRT